MSEKATMKREPATDLVPVFHGLALIGVSGKDMAAALRVSTASISKWRNGHTVTPDVVKVFLTLMLGDHVSRASEYANRLGRPDHDPDRGSDGDDASAQPGDGVLDEALATLARQERLNHAVPAMAIREGARRYRLWWNATRNAACLKPEDLMRDLGSQFAAGIR